MDVKLYYMVREFIREKDIVMKGVLYHVGHMALTLYVMMFMSSFGHDILKAYKLLLEIRFNRVIEL